MTAEPLLDLVARLLAKHGLDAVLIGNAAAALQGSPVTTLDLDFMFRKTARNLQKLRGIADDLGATVYRSYYPASEMYCVMRDADGLRLNFTSVRGSAASAMFAGHEIEAAALRGVVRSKQAPNRSHDRAGRRRTRKKSALRRESDRALLEQIRRLLALPMEKRTGFLRRRRPFFGSSL